MEKREQSELLTGKCKEAFEKWYELSEHFGKETGTTEPNHPVASIKKALTFFYARHSSMQYGVYVDFFDSVGIIVYESPSFNNGWAFTTSHKESFRSISYDTRPEASKAAIAKANEIYNSK